MSEKINHKTLREWYSGLENALDAKDNPPNAEGTEFKAGDLIIKSADPASEQYNLSLQKIIDYIEKHQPTTEMLENPTNRDKNILYQYMNWDIFNKAKTTLGLSTKPTLKVKQDISALINEFKRIKNGIRITDSYQEDVTHINPTNRLICSEKWVNEVIGPIHRSGKRLPNLCPDYTKNSKVLNSKKTKNSKEIFNYNCGENYLTCNVCIYNADYYTCIVRQGCSNKATYNNSVYNSKCTDKTGKCAVKYDKGILHNTTTKRKCTQCYNVECPETTVSFSKGICKTRKMEYAVRANDSVVKCENIVESDDIIRYIPKN